MGQVPKGEYLGGLWCHRQGLGGEPQGPACEDTVNIIDSDGTETERDGKSTSLHFAPGLGYILMVNGTG